MIFFEKSNLNFYFRVTGGVALNIYRYRQGSYVTGIHFNLYVHRGNLSAETHGTPTYFVYLV